MANQSARANAAAKRVATILDPRQMGLVETFFNESLFAEPVPAVGAIRARNLVLFAATDPELNRRIRLIFRQRRSELHAKNIVYIDQRQIERLHHGGRWASRAGITNQQLGEFAASLADLFVSECEGLRDMGTALIAHDAFAGVPGKYRPIPNPPSIAARTIRQLRSWISAPRVRLVLHEREDSDRLRSLYSHHTNRGGAIDPEFFLAPWLDSPADVIDQLVIASVMGRNDVRLDRVKDTTGAVASLAKVDRVLAACLQPLAPDLAAPFDVARSIRASQILARINRHANSPRERKSARKFVDSELRSAMTGEPS